MTILRNYVAGRNPLDGIAFDLWGLFADLSPGWLAAAGSAFGVVTHFLGLLYTRRVIRLFALPAGLFLSPKFSKTRGLAWGLMGVAVLLLGIAAGLEGSRLLVHMMVCMALGVLALVDWHTGLLPDELTLPLLWGGLVWAAWGNGVSLHLALGGVVVSYLFLVIIFQVYYWVRRREGMGFGDFKLTAALGAWVGWPQVAELLLVACLAGVLLALARMRFRGVAPVLPFGPSLSMSGVLYLTGLSP